ncbi:MAG: hypothetical protein GXP25_08920 [Planctomycetes bacterium]|nr:hypothetical protein [Planctomycetota bacterium]
MNRRMTRWVFVVLLAIGLPGLAQEKPAPDKPFTDAELKQLTERMTHEVERLRGLKFKHPVEKGIKSRKALREFVVDQMREDMPPERLVAFQKALIHFGLLAKDTQLEETLVDFLTANIGGFYDHKRKELFLMRDVARAFQSVALSHEMTHSLQDQYFDLGGLPIDDKVNDDLAIASLAVIEGDATEVMYRYVQEVMLKNAKDVAELAKLGDVAARETESFKKAPLYLQRNLIFPYSNGLAFINHLKRLGGEEKVNEAFKSPPLSSEQILHPEKYTTNRDDPVFLRLPDLAPILGPDWKYVIANVLGELNVQVLCETFDLAAVSGLVSSGWDGDQYVAYERPDTGQVFVAWLSTWDTPKDAGEFFDVYRAILIKKYPKASLIESDVSNQWVWRTPTQGYVMIERKGRDVLVLDGFPPGKAHLLRQAAWRAERSPRPFKKGRVKAAAPIAQPPPAAPPKQEQARLKVDKEAVDKAYDDVARQMGMDAKQLKTMTEQLAGSQKSKGRIVGRQFIDRGQGFKISHPPGWAFATDLPVPMLSVAITGKGGSAIVTVVSFPFGMEPVEMWMPMLEGMYGMQFQQFKKIRAGRKQFNNIQAYELLFTGTKNGRAVKARQVVFPTPVRTYVIMCVAPVQRYEASAAGFASILNSFKVLTPPPAPRPQEEKKPAEQPGQP